MKNKLLLLQEKLLLKKRGMIEPVIDDILKTICNLEHTRHRSAINMLVNTYAALYAYVTLKRNPSVSMK